MRKVYADHGATSFPKAPGVSDAMKDFLDNVGCNVNRGGYAPAYHTAAEILHTRKLLCELFHFDEPRNVIFTPGVTYSLNMILQGFLKEGDHVITSALEHNAVMRPLHALSKNGIAYDIVPCAGDGTLDAGEIKKRIRPNTRAVVMTHASNVCGTVLPVEDAGEICAARGIALIVDSAQSAGILDIDMAYIDALAFTGHKGLLSAPGLGGIVLKSGFAERMEPVVTGGTGSLSHELRQPDFLPDKFESGTMNIPAILGLKEALAYIGSVGINTILEAEAALTERFISGIDEIGEMGGVRLVGKRGGAGRIAVISLDFTNRDNAEIAAALDGDYGIMTRCGLHCAPVAHRALGTYPQGTVRFSFGHFNTAGEVDYILHSLREILSKGVS